MAGGKESRNGGQRKIGRFLDRNAGKDERKKVEWKKGGMTGGGHEKAARMGGGEESGNVGQRNEGV